MGPEGSWAGQVRSTGTEVCGAGGGLMAGGCSWAWGRAPWVCSSPSGWGLEAQKQLAGGQVGGMQCSQINSFPCSGWLLVLPHGRPSTSTSLGYLAHGLSDIEKAFRNPQVQSLISWGMRLLSPIEGKGTPSLLSLSKALAEPGPGKGCWSRL